MPLIQIPAPVHAIGGAFLPMRLVVPGARGETVIDYGRALSGTGTTVGACRQDLYSPSNASQAYGIRGRVRIRRPSAGFGPDSAISAWLVCNSGSQRKRKPLDLEHLFHAVRYRTNVLLSRGPADPFKVPYGRYQGYSWRTTAITLPCTSRLEG